VALRGTGWGARGAIVAVWTVRCTPECSAPIQPPHRP